MDAKKVLLLVGGALLLFYMITQPAQGAAAVTAVLGWLRDGLMALIDFVRPVFGGG